MSNHFNWEALGIDEGGLPDHLPMGVNRYRQGPTEPQPAHHYECWCRDVDCPLTLVLQHAWLAGRRVATGEYEREVPEDAEPPQCGGCRGEGAHRRHCPRNPDYSPWTVLADMAEDLGDRIGPNDMGAANRAWQLAGEMRAHGREDIERRKERNQ